jgi:hypothetical protein
LELTSFEYPLVSRISRSSPKPLPRIYIKKENLEHRGGRIICRVMLSKYRGDLHSTTTTIRFPSLIKKLRRSKEKGAKEDASTLKV